MANDHQARTIQGVTHGTAVVRLSHTDCTTAGLTQSILLSALRVEHPGAQAGLIPENAVIKFAYVRLFEVFAGGTVATATVGLGDTAIPTELLAAHDVFTGAALAPGTTPGAYSLGIAIEADYTTAGAAVLVTTSVGNVADLTTGEADICIVYQALTTDSLTG